ncbi:MAG: TIR domain-containing protein [Pedobacter sp.]|nr:MAG: TIR domain-containing protein [Pedobacter sp.]
MNKERQTKYDIALSFAGEDRDYVAQVAISLKEKGIHVFYDRFDEVNLWGKNLYEYLSDIYQNQAKFTIIFISKHYNEKLWTNHERQSMQARAFQESSEYILPVRFDNTDVKGILNTTGYLDLDGRSPESLAFTIEQKLIESGATIPSEYLRKSYSAMAVTAKPDQLPESLRIISELENPVNNAKIILSADNGTFLDFSSKEDGLVFLSMPVKRNYTLLIANPDYPSVIIENFVKNGGQQITLKKAEGIGSMIINSTGYIPGFNGRLAPILDSGNRTYLYADNIAINGETNQPAYFVINEPFTLEDATGTIITVNIRFMKGNITLLDYTRPG